MIAITIPDPNTDAWRRWRERCAAEREKAVQAYEAGDAPVISSVYRDRQIKTQVYEARDGPFCGKCAYCESPTAVNQPGDIEHYRPKCSVRDGSRTRVTTSDGQLHPGYFWLAYDLDNLLFVCEDCNRVTRGKGERLIGKGDCFPVRAYRAERPCEEAREEPLLINPLREEPSHHLGIGPDGVMFGRSDRGDASIDVLGLNDRDSLLAARAAGVRDAKASFMFELVSRLSGGASSDARSRIEEIISGVRPYAMAERVGLSEGKKAAFSTVGALPPHPDE